ncbi:peptidoglycan-binding protein [Streptomyces sp. NPDC059680]|uniref:peptidoglycan-binding protein n=1 Tax=Streptomyces TaxID=1883 RepID=UPI001E49334E|nr:peptidoglycan-binding protein [Streptomyces barringtoniae]MCC5478708.1 peptidoglycan-binding protein [Streptomyces barringtoniae]
MGIFDDLNPFAALETPAGRRSWLADLCTSIPKATDKNDLLDLIDNALLVSAPAGDTATLESLGTRYRGQVDKAGELHDRVNRVAHKGLPEVWVGHTSVLASDAVAGAARAATKMSEAFQGGAKALHALADALGTAKKQDADGRALMQQAKERLGPRDSFFDFGRLIETAQEKAEKKAALEAGRGLAADGVESMHKGAVSADDAVRAAARDLNKWAAEARAGKMHSGQLSAVDRMMLADTSGKDGAPDYNEILTAGELERSGRAMDQLSPADRARMDRLLAGAGTPQEKAYLMKALAAGHGVDDIQAFDGKIHGKDPAWLQRHLAPIVTGADSLKDEGTNPLSGANMNTELQDFDGQQWAQGGDGQDGTCVASTTVAARAVVDPVYALSLTGGPSGQEDDPEAFRQRLVAEQHRMHLEGHGGADWEGMNLQGQEQISNKEISPQTGSAYELHEVRNPDARRDILPAIEKSVADGKPVPFDAEGVTNGKWNGHSMMIVGQEGDKLEIYNPWGRTTWISEDDFVNGGMAKASDNRYHDAYAVHLPQD